MIHVELKNCSFGIKQQKTTAFSSIRFYFQMVYQHVAKNIQVELAVLMLPVV